MEILLALLIPPAAIWYCRDSFENSRSKFKRWPASFLVCLLLWAAGILPGVLYAMWIVSQHREYALHRHHPQLGRPNPFGTP